MAVVEMSKVSLIALQKDKKLILEKFMELEICELKSVDEKIDAADWAKLTSRDGDVQKISNLESKIEKLTFVLDYLGKHDTRKKGFFGVKRYITKLQLAEVLKEETRLWLVTQEVIQAYENLTSLKSEKNKKANLILSLNPWKSLDVPLNHTNTKKSIMLTGIIPAIEEAESFKENLKNAVPQSNVEILSKDANQSYLFVIYHRDFEDEVKKVFKQWGFANINFRDLEGTAINNIQRLSREIENIDAEISRIELNTLDLARELSSLEVLYDYLVLKRDRELALGNLLKTEKTFVLEGWIPKELGQKVKKIFEEKWDVFIEIIEATEEDEIPILLENKGLAQSVEPVTAMYSLPDKREIDPNPIMAIFFVIFFGLMLSDGGYGMAMTFVSATVLWKFKLEDSLKKYAKLMMYCGISTMFWGALFGGWFGIAAFTNFGLWFNPIENPEELLKWSLFFGVIHIYVGIGMRGINLFRQRKYLDIVFDVLLWYVFFTGFVFVVLPFTPKVDPSSVIELVNIGKYMLGIGGVLLVLTQGRKDKGFTMKIVGGFGSLYNLIGFMSDVLSYSRLLALGLATSVIASIVNEMAVLMGLNNIFKIILAIVVLVVGHTFNFAINALGAYVHSSRLQYIEFFGKFYKGGGKAFQPLKINTKYINFNN
jgi:V/A-type H+-transporting ATPase subunit I